MIKDGGGTLTLVNNNGYTGGTIISNGTLRIGNGNTTGTLGAGNVINNGTLVIDRSDTSTVANNISGTGGFRVGETVGNLVYLTGTNTYSGITQITTQSVGLVIGNGGTSGTLGTGNVQDNSMLGFWRSDTLVVSNLIGGIGGLEQIGSGTTVLLRNNTYDGSTTISNGVLQVGNGGNTGSLGSGDVLDNSSLVFNRSNNPTVANNISGTGSLTQTGGGILTLTGSNTYTGTTLINNGSTLRAALTPSLAPGNLVLNNGVYELNGGGTFTRGLGTGSNQVQVLGGTSGFSTIGGAGTINLGGAGAAVTWGSAYFNPTVLVLNAATADSPLIFVNGLDLNGANRRIGVYGDPNIAPVTITGNIIGYDNLSQIGNGRLILAGNNTNFYGDITIGAGSTLQIGNGASDGSLGAGYATVHNFGTLIFDVTNNYAVTDTINGSGNVIQEGSGPITLMVANSYGGGTIITNGATLFVNAAGALGGGPVTMFNGTTLGFLSGFNNQTLVNQIILTGDPTIFVTNGVTATESGSISGAGDLVKTGAGALILAADNFYTGATTISNGVLQIGSANGFSGTLGTGSVTNWSSLVFFRGDTIVVSNTISGTGSLTQQGTGTLILTGSNDYSGTTLISAGALQVGNGGTLGTLGTGAVVDNASLLFNRSDTITVSNTISGSGIVRQQGTGTTIVTGNNSYIGGTWIDFGTLAVGSNNALGIGAVTMNGGTLGAQGNQTLGNAFHLPVNGNFDTTGGNLTLNGQIEGIGMLINAGTGSLTLNHANIYSGGTSNNGGWLVVGSNGALGTGLLVMNGGTLSSGGGTLTITLANQITLAAITNNVDTTGGNLILKGPITGDNDLWKYGANTLTLTGTNIYRDTYVQAGTLEITGSGITSNRSAYIGLSTNAAAAVVSGSGSSWIMNQTLVVGDYGSGNSLTVTNRGFVSDNYGWVGYHGNNNSALVTGTNSVWNNNSDLTIGNYANGNTLTINNGGVVSNVWGSIGGYWNDPSSSGSSNSVTVNGNGSTWINNGPLIVGVYNASNNSLTITNGGFVSNGNNGFVAGIVGGINSFNNSALVSGSGSVWNIGGPLSIGYHGGSGNTLTINNGGVVSNTTGFIGGFTIIPGSSVNNSAVVDGNGSRWINSGDLYVGANAGSEFNSLIITNGGSVSSRNGFVGYEANNNSALVSGSNSSWVMTGDLTVGYRASGNILTINNGGIVSNANGYIGYGTPISYNTGIVDNATWVNTGTLIVGTNDDHNTLIIQNGGVVSSASGYVGVDVSGNSNNVLVTGTHSEWNMTGNLTVGQNGNSNLMTINNGGNVSDLNGYVGSNAGANNNQVLVDNGRWYNSGSLTIGLQGGEFNSMTISNGGYVQNDYGFIGTNAANNSVLVTGANSIWQNNADLRVGSGAGSTNNSLTINNRGLVNNGGGRIGDYADSNWVLVDNGTWTNNGNLWIGHYGNNNALIITNGGAVSTINAYVGDNGNNNNALVTGDGSIWNNEVNFNIGNNGSSNSLLVTSGGHVTAGGSASIGITSSSINNVATVTGGGSLWDIAGDLTVGVNGSFNQMYILNNGVVSNASGIVGDLLGADNNSVLVDNGTWINRAILVVGNHGASNSLTIQNGGDVFSVFGAIGQYEGASNNIVTVTGSNSVWNDNGYLNVGDQGAWNSLIISNGGVVSDTYANIGVNSSNANFNTVTVTGTGSIWTNSYDLRIGYRGADNTLTISNGGVVYSVNSVIGYHQGSSNNSVVVTGGGSAWNMTGDLIVGRSDSGNSLQILSSGVVNDVNGTIGYYGGGSDGAVVTNNTVLVSGAGSQWNNSGSLTVGRNGQFNSLTISNGGYVVNQAGIIGAYGNSNSVLVTGSGSLWQNNDQLTIGQNGSFNQMTIADGGRVNDTKGDVGYDGASNTVLVTGSASGTPSLWNNSEDLVIGDHTTGNQMIITNGGEVAVGGQAYIGYQPSAGNNSVFVTGSGSVWTNSNNLYVGLGGSANQMLITAGGVVYDLQGFVGNNDTSANNSVLVDGSAWINSSNLVVGVNGSFNSLTVQRGGVVDSANGFIGYSASASNNSALVTRGSTWNNTGDVTVGNDGASYNTLTISRGGTVNDVNGYIGRNASNNSGTVTTGGTWNNNSGNLTIGLNGDNNSLTVSRGGTVNDVNGYVGAGGNNNSVVGDHGRFLAQYGRPDDWQQCLL